MSGRHYSIGAVIVRIALSDPDHVLSFTSAPAPLGLAVWLIPSIRRTLPSAAGAGNALRADRAHAIGELYAGHSDPWPFRPSAGTLIDIRYCNQTAKSMVTAGLHKYRVSRLSR